VDLGGGRMLWRHDAGSIISRKKAWNKTVRGDGILTISINVST